MILTKNKNLHRLKRVNKEKAKNGKSIPEIVSERKYAAEIISHREGKKVRPGAVLMNA